MGDSTFWTIFWAAAAVIVAAAVPLFVFYLEGRRIKAGGSELSIEGADWVLERRLTYYDLLKVLVGIDYQNLAGEGFSERAEGTPEQWAPVFEKSPETWRLVKFRNSVIVAYWSFFSLSAELVARLRSGEMYDSEVTEGHIRNVEEAGGHDLYCAMVAEIPGFEGKGGRIFRMLISSMAESLSGLIEDGVEIRGIYAVAFTPHGANLCRRLKMSAVGEAKAGGTVYHTTLTSATSRAAWCSQAAAKGEGKILAIGASSICSLAALPRVLVANFPEVTIAPLCVRT